MIKVEIHTEKELRDFAEDALHILVNLRFHTRYWNENFGHAARERKQYWEQKADEFLARHGVNEHLRTGKISVVRDGT